MNPQRLFIFLGIALVVVGLLWPWIGRLPLGRLPGDIIINKPNVKIFFPITTMVLLSIVVSLLIQLFKKFHP